MSSNTTHVSTQHFHREQQNTLPSPSTPSNLSRRIHSFLIPFHRVCWTWCEHIASLLDVRLMAGSARPLAPSAEPSYALNPAIEKLATQRMQQIQAQADAETAQIAAQDLELRQNSLLHTATRQAKERQKQGQHEETALAFETLRALLKWRTASISHYGAWLTGADPNAREALQDWQRCEETLQKACTQAPQGDASHALSYYEALCALASPRSGSNGIVRYSGAFGKQQTLLQAALSKLYTQYLKTQPLPDFVKEGMEKGAIDSLESLFSYGFDLFWQYALQEQPEQSSEKLRDALQLLKPYLPDIKRRSSPYLPSCVRDIVDQPLRQGLLSLFLDLIPDSLLRDHCVDLVAILAEGAHTQDFPVYLAQWKQRFIQKALAALPSSSFETFNEEIDKSFHAFLHRFNDILDGLGTGMEEHVNETLFTYGTYLLEWEYDASEKTYCVTLFASGSSLKEPNYPRDSAGNPLWPISLSGISPTPALLDALKK